MISLTAKKRKSAMRESERRVKKKPLKKSVLDIHIAEIIGLVILGFVLIFFIVPLVNRGLSYLRHEPNPEIKNQFEQLVIDIDAIPNGEEFYVAFAVNIKKPEYKLTFAEKCQGDEKSERDNCLQSPEICITEINGEGKPICRDITDGNFRTNGEIIPLGIVIGIKKDAEGMVELKSNI